MKCPNCGTYINERQDMRIAYMQLLYNYVKNKLDSRIENETELALLSHAVSVLGNMLTY